MPFRLPSLVVCPGHLSSFLSPMSWTPVLLPQSYVLDTRLPSSVLCPGHPSSFLSPMSWTPQVLEHHSVGGAVITGGATPRKEGGGGNPVTRRLRAQGAFQSSSGPAAPTSFGCIRQSFASGGPMSSPLSPKTISSWAPGLPRLQG